VENYEATDIPERIFFINNTVAGNTYGLTGGDNIVVLNNIFANTIETALKDTDGNSIAAYNLFRNNGVNVDGAEWMEETCLFANPFLNAEFGLLALSSCIDAGIPASEWNNETLLSRTDFESSDSDHDLGAFEYEAVAD
ncbi:hypothetical protein IH601_04670, partial [Candidatus Bipolaricaulota bacterium]|nr:hypothetical protein [Candidatus Bipolaricaulota bacterium]